MVDGTLFENEVSQGFVVRGSISLGKVLMHCVREKIMEEGRLKQSNTDGV